MSEWESDLEYLDFDEIRRMQIRRIGELMAGPWAEAPGLVARLDEAGVSPADLAAAAGLAPFPILRKAELPALQAADPPFGGLVTLPPGKLRRIFSSPGPIYDPEGDLPSYYRWERAFAAAGFGEGDVVLNCFAYHLTPAGAMFEEGVHNLGGSVIPAGIGNTGIQVAVAAHLRANGYVGLPSYLDVLCRKADEAGLDLALEKAFVLAEKLPESLRRDLEERRGIRVRQGYGTAELGAVAYECDEARGLHLDPGAHVEIVDPGTGKPLGAGAAGEVVVTPLNPVYALLRFATGDLSAIDETPCPCGRRTPRLLGILGRVDQVTKVRGLFVHPSQVEEAVAGFPGLRRFRAAVVRKRAMDDLVLEVEGDLDGKALEELAARARRLLKLALEVVRVPEGTISEDAAIIDDRRTWE